MVKVGSKVVIPAGTKITTGEGQVKAERDFTVTVSDVKQTKAGNSKVTWRGHRSMKSAVIKK